MKHSKFVAALLCVVLACVLFLSACTGTVTEVNGLEDALKSASVDYLKDQVKTNLEGYSVNADAIQITQITNEENVYTVSGVVGLTDAEGTARTADFTLKMEFINYVDQTTACFRMLEANVADPA